MADPLDLDKLERIVEAMTPGRWLSWNIISLRNAAPALIARVRELEAGLRRAIYMIPTPGGGEVEYERLLRIERLRALLPEGEAVKRPVDYILASEDDDGSDEVISTLRATIATLTAERDDLRAVLTEADADTADLSLRDAVMHIGQRAALLVAANKAAARRGAERDEARRSLDIAERDRDNFKHALASTLARHEKAARGSAHHIARLEENLAAARRPGLTLTAEERAALRWAFLYIYSMAIEVRPTDRTIACKAADAIDRLLAGARTVTVPTAEDVERLACCMSDIFSSALQARSDDSSLPYPWDAVARATIAAGLDPSRLKEGT